MSKMEESAAIPEAGHKIPETEPLPTLGEEESISQGHPNQGVMNVEVALVHALQYLAKKSENSQP